jgi:glycosyltransferase involved in cell wall biosynthesis
VIIPIYNVEQFLPVCLDSVVNQSYEKIEIIAINDGSTDNSLCICEEYSKNHKHFHIINQKNMGLGMARNVGIEKACGEYIVFLDSDDFLHPEFCRIMYDAIENYGVPMTVCHMVRVDEKGILLSNEGQYMDGKAEIFSADELIQEVINYRKGLYFSSMCGKMFDKSLFKIGANRFPTGVYYEDNWLSMKLLIEAEQLCLVNNELYSYRERFGSTTNLLRFRAKNILDYYVQFANTINVLVKHGKVAFNTKMDFVRQVVGVIGGIYIGYLMAAFQAQLISDSFNNKRKLALFGAGSLGRRFRRTVLFSVQPENIVFVDNDCNKHGTKVDGIPVVSLDEYYSVYSDHKIIITTYNFIELVLQLLEVKTTDKLAEIFPYNGETSYEKAFLQGIDYFTSTLQELGTHKKSKQQ